MTHSVFLVDLWFNWGCLSFGDSSDLGMFDCLRWMTFQFGETFGPSTVLMSVVMRMMFFFVPVDLCRYSLHCMYQPQEKLDLSEREKPKDIFTVNESVSIYLLPITSHILKHIHIYIYLYIYISIFIYIYICILYLFLWYIYIYLYE